MESIPGQMAGSMMANGKMEDSTEKESIYQNRDSIDPASGKMVKERDGSTKMNPTSNEYEFKI